MTIDIAYWQGVGEQLDWSVQLRDPAWNLDPNDSNPRQRGYIDYYIIHHGASTSEAGMVLSMQPGGRTVTAQWILCTDGKFRPNIPIERRAYTSSSWLDDIACTVETVNTSGDPTWGINDLQKMAHALNAVALYRSGKLKSLTRAHIIGHYEVLGISGSGYSTACPGPDMQLDLIVELAQAIDNGVLGPNSAPPAPPKEDDMLIYLPYSDSKDGVIRGGTSYISDGGPLRPLSRAEYGAYDYWNGKDGKAEAAFGYTVKVRWVKWSGDAVRDATRYVGVMEQTGLAAGDVPILSGKIIYDDPAKSTFPRVSVS